MALATKDEHDIVKISISIFLYLVQGCLIETCILNHGATIPKGIVDNLLRIQPVAILEM